MWEREGGQGGIRQLVARGPKKKPTTKKRLKLL